MIKEVMTILRENPWPIPYAGICQALSDRLKANVLLVKNTGEILSSCLQDDLKDVFELEGKASRHIIEEMINERLLYVLSTKEDINLPSLGISNTDYKALVVPLLFAGRRLATLFSYRPASYEADDLVAAEYVGAVLSLLLEYYRRDGQVSSERNQQILAYVNSTLSRTELKAIRDIYRELSGLEDGIIVASKIANNLGITRSVVINALRKLQSANILQTRSSGMRGTRIHVCNPAVFEGFAPNNYNRSGI